MTYLTYAGETYAFSPGESVLECLLRHQIEYPHSCQAGVCQSCLIKSPGQIAPAWQEGIQDTLKAQGYFLACLARPDCALHILSPLSDECAMTAKIISLIKLNYNVLQLKLSVEDLCVWIPGQYLNLVNPNGIIRSYSIANLPAQDGFIELHIKLQQQGAMSHWLQDKAQVDDSVQIRGPLGKCFYFNPQKLDYNILLAGTGTGLAPLVAIVRDALMQNHLGEITLIHGGLKDEDLYYVNELKQLSSQYPQFHYESCVLKSEAGLSESLDKKTLTHIKDVKNLKFFVCGPKEIIDVLKVQAFCAGVSSSNIFSDTFL